MTEDESSSLEQALAVGRDRGVDEIVLALPWSDNPSSNWFAIGSESRRSRSVAPRSTIRSLAENPSFRLRRSLSIEIQRGPLSRVEQTSKRIVDIVGASLGLSFCSRSCF